MTARAYVFDAYGTLLDVHSAVARHRALLGPEAARLSELWRAKQLEYTWVRSLMGAYRDFHACTEAALDYAATRCGGIPAEVRAKLLAAYDTLAPFPEVAAVLRGLKARGAVTAILSNGTAAMLESAVTAAGLAGLFDHVVSVDDAGVFKTDPRCYRLAADRLDLAPEAVSFQSSNRWDIAGAVRFGFAGVWINRNGLPEEYPDLAPRRILASLDGLLG